MCMKQTLLEASLQKKKKKKTLLEAKINWRCSTWTLPENDHKYLHCQTIHGNFHVTKWIVYMKQSKKL